MTDSDGDGLTDDIELLNKTNPQKTDSDEDGINDYAEIKVHKTLPYKKDSDGDASPSESFL